MNRSPWICTRCLRQIAHHAPPRKLPPRRLQSTAATTQSDSLSPSLLTRARELAAEHASLTDQIANGFDAKSARRLGEVSSTVSALKEYENATSALSELQQLLRSQDAELRELAEEDVEPTRDRISVASQTLKKSMIPVHPFAHFPCLIEIRPGAGGDEAALFAGDLLNMYSAFCSRQGLHTNIVKLETGEAMASGVGSGHVQEAVLEVESHGAYGRLRCEAGVHRVQRVPATESKGRTHTSAVSVLVLPSLPSEGSGEWDEKSFNDPESDYYVNPSDVRTDVMRARGAGGQHVNTTDSAVRLTHVPTGTVVAMQDSRSQPKNKEKAWKVLRSKLAQMRREAREDEVVQLRRGAGAGKVGRENKVRTYNWGQQRVSDHRSNFDIRNLDEVMEGGDALDTVMESVRVWMSEQEVLGLAAESDLKRKSS